MKKWREIFKPIIQRSKCKTKVPFDTQLKAAIDVQCVTLGGATSRFVEKFSLYFSSWSFIILINLLHPQPSLFPYDFLLFLSCFSILKNYYFQDSFNLKAILYVAKITKNTVTELLSQVIYQDQERTLNYLLVSISCR